MQKVRTVTQLVKIETYALPLSRGKRGEYDERAANMNTNGCKKQKPFYLWIG